MKLNKKKQVWYVGGELEDRIFYDGEDDTEGRLIDYKTAKITNIEDMIKELNETGIIEVELEEGDVLDEEFIETHLIAIESEYDYLVCYSLEDAQNMLKELKLEVKELENEYEETDEEEFGYGMSGICTIWRPIGFDEE